MELLTETTRLSIASARRALNASDSRTSVIADEALTGLLTDLRHFCRERRIDFERAQRLSGLYYQRDRRPS